MRAKGAFLWKRERPLFLPLNPHTARHILNYLALWAVHEIVRKFLPEV